MIGRRTAIWLMLLGLMGCQEPADTIRVGAKTFAEQEILAHAATGVLRESGLDVGSVVSCGDTFDCQRMLREGRIDLMVEYTGTGLFFLGTPVKSAREDASLPRVTKLYEPLGLAWQGALGFDNGYRLLVTSERAAAVGLTDIADLEKFEGGVRIGSPPAYLRRPGDGLGALFERYGLRTKGDPIAIETINNRVQALLDGRADVIIAYATDGAIADLGLKVLSDSKGFFPPYEAAFVVRQPTLKRSPAIGEALAKMAGKLDVETMRKLNYAVEVEGRAPAEVAQSFLKEAKLVSQGTSDKARQADLVVAVHRSDSLEILTRKAISATRSAFPKRSVQLQPEKAPIEKVARGGPRLLLVGAERLFSSNGDATPKREERVQAAAVVGRRLVHVLVPTAAEAGTDPLGGRVGIPPKGSGAWIVASGLLEGASAQAAPHKALVSKLNAGELDALVWLTQLGDPALVEALASGKFKLVALPGWLTSVRASRMPYLRSARIPAGTYKNQPQAIETLGVQVVLAGPAPLQEAMPAGGPVSSLMTAGLPLSPKEVQALADATRVPEAPDPALPSAWNTTPRPDEGADSVSDEIIATLLNLLTIIFLFWLVTLALKPQRRSEE